jgi:hypothetical protein
MAIGSLGSSLHRTLLRFVEVEVQWMSRSTRTPITQSEVTRLLRAAKAAGLDVSSLKMEADGSVVIRTGEPESNSANSNALDKWMKENAGST